MSLSSSPARLIAAGTAVLAVAGIALLAAGRPKPAPQRTLVFEPASNAKPRASQRLADLGRAVPGNGGEAPSGRSTWADDRFARLAYPADDIELEWLESARAGYADVARRGVGQGKNSTGTWFSLGPTSAVYQETPYRRFTYVPSRYVSSGRVTAMAMAPTCTLTDCRLWVAAAGGGIWRTDKALQGSPRWTYLGGSLGINAIGAISVDPNDSSGNTLYVGTGEANGSGDSAAGVGVYKSTDGGTTWAGLSNQGPFNGRAVGSVAVHPSSPNVLYVGTTRAVRGVASTGGGVSLIPGAAAWGLYKSTDGGQTWAYVHNGAANTAACGSNLTSVANNATPCSPRGVRRLALDPLDPNVVYAASFGRGIWRSRDGGSTWTRIKKTVFEEVTDYPTPVVGNFSPVVNDRPEFALTVAGGATRMYVGQGAVGGGVRLVAGGPIYPVYSRFSRTDNANADTVSFAQLTSPDRAQAGYGSYDYCGGQCWYDNLVVTPAGHPDLVYLGGSFLYSEVARVSNGRGVVLSTDAGASWFDMTEDSSNKWFPNGMHPDQHALVVNPANPFQFIEGSDGGVVRSNGVLQDSSHRCDARGLSEPSLGRCRQLLSNTPQRLESLNTGLSTLQFQSLSVDPSNPKNIQGGTQDNGTFETANGSVVWQQTFWGDGGQSGFDAADRLFRFHTFYNATPDVNFSNGALHDWNWIGDPTYGTNEPQAFYPPIISDPVKSRWMWAGLSHVWRTKTHGMGSRSLAEFREQCNEFKGVFATVCGDWEPLGADSYTPPPPFYAANNPSPSSYLTGTKYANATFSRAGGTVSVVERAPGDATTLWAATSAGRVFVSVNADAEPAAAVSFERIDTAATPGRFVSGIHVDPVNSNRAWVSYTGFSAATPTTVGHVFEVAYDPTTGTAAWTSIDNGLADIPLNDVARDDASGALYVASDFGVMRLDPGASAWVMAAAGLPNAEVSGLTIVPSARKLYAATHGLGAWSLTLP